MSGSPLLRVSHLSKVFHGGGDFEVLRNINLEVNSGEFISIVGTSGCGKSTLLRIISGLETEFSGDVYCEDTPARGTSLDRGIVFQDHRLFPWLTVEQNIAVALMNLPQSKAEKARLVKQHIDMIHLNGFENALPHQLSGGMSQRVAIARAIVTYPKLLLLDEPFGALDAFTKNKLQKELKGILAQEGITAIMVTHDIEEAIYLSDRLVIMDSRPGRIKQIVDVNLPLPRIKTEHDFIAVRDRVLGYFSE